MVRTLHDVEAAVAAALSRYLTEAEPDAERARELNGAVAALMGALLASDERWSPYWWVDDVLPDAIQRDGVRSVSMSGLAITADESHQWLEPFRAVVALSTSGTELAGHQVSVGDASVGLATVATAAAGPWPGQRYQPGSSRSTR